MLSFYFNSRSKNFVSGIKVICKGKWTKTGTGRTQKIILNFGRLNNQTFSYFLDSYVSTAVTKFGVCSVKVLISYNKVERRF
jgi:ribosomal protein S3